MAALSLCFRLSVELSSPDSLPLHSWGCWSVPGPSGSRLRCRGQGDSALFSCSASPVAALAPAPGLPFIELRRVSRCRLPPSSLPVAAMYLSSRSPRQARVRLHSVRRQRLPYIQCPENCGKTAIDFRVWTLPQLPLGHHSSAIHLSTTSRPLLRFWLLPLLPSAARRFWLQWCRPVWWS